MKTFAVSKLILGLLLAAAVHAAPANAQATRTWVSGLGSDTDPCSLTAPCKTFAGAMSKTASGGEISVLGPGGYGSVTIDKPITINGEGTLASILASSGTGIIVNAGAGGKVVLRNLMITGAGGGGIGVNIVSGDVSIQNCMISQFTNGFIGGIGIYMSGSSTSIISVIDTNLVNNSHGTWLATSSGFAIASFDNVRVTGSSGYGVIASNNAFITLNRSYVASAGTGGLLTNATGATINANDSTLTNNAIAVSASASGSTIRLNNVSLYDNTTALVTAGGATIATANNNKAAGNGGALTTNGTVTNF
jgi:hypothetical protein